MKKFLIIIIALLIFAVPIKAQQISNDARLEYNHGIDYYKNGEYDKAMASFRKAISYSPDYIDAYYNLGTILEYLNQYDYALEMFKQIILRAPDDYEAVYKAGALANKTGDSEKALYYLESIPLKSKYYKNAILLIDQIKEAQPKAQSEKIKTKNINSETNLFENIPSPTGVVADIYGNIYVAQFNDNTILQIQQDNTKKVYVKDNKINGPIGMAIDLEGNLYIANYKSNNVIKIKRNKEITVLIGNLKQPYGLYLKDDVLYISLQGMNSVLRYRLYN